MQIKFYVPDQLVQSYLGVHAILDDIVKIAGGMTVYKADGVWCDDNDHVVEKVGVFEVYMIDDRPTQPWNNRKALLGRALETLANILGTAGEKSFLYTVDNVPTFVDLSKVAVITL